MFDILFLVRAAHILAAATWIGGSLFYQFVVIPALKTVKPSPEFAAQVALLFKRMVTICIAVLLLSGVYLTFDRLSETALGMPYLIVLSIKIVLALIMFVLAMYVAQSAVRRLAKRVSWLSRTAPQILLALGVCVFILGALLNSLFEASVVPH